MKRVVEVIVTGIAAGIIAGCASGPAASVQPTPVAQGGAAPFRLSENIGLEGRAPTPCINEFCRRDTYDLAWEHYYDYPVSYRTRQLQYDRNQLEYGYLRRDFDLWEPLTVVTK